jgi:chemotaxis protein CheX
MTLDPKDLAEIEEIARDVWSSLLGLEITVAQAPDACPEEVVTAVVTVSGDAHGVVGVQTSGAGARAMAAAMFMMGADEVGEAEVADALGELTNVVGGNVKGLLPGSNRLSLPTVLDAGAEDPRDLTQPPLAEVFLTCDGEPVLIALHALAAVRSAASPSTAPERIPS